MNGLLLISPDQGEALNHFFLVKIHALIEYPPKLSISQIVNSLKGVSSRRYGQSGFPKPYGKEALWSPSYFASSVGGAPLEVLKRYIQNQLKPS